MCKEFEITHINSLQFRSEFDRKMKVSWIKLQYKTLSIHNIDQHKIFSLQNYCQVLSFNANVPTQHVIKYIYIYC